MIQWYVLKLRVASYWLMLDSREEFVRQQYKLWHTKQTLAPAHGATMAKALTRLVFHSSYDFVGPA